MSLGDNQTITIAMKTMDNELFEVEKSVSMEMGTVKAYLKDDETADFYSVVPLHNVSLDQLSKIVIYIKKYLELKAYPDAKNNIRAYNEQFVSEQSNIDELKKLYPTSWYLGVDYLTDLLSMALADHLKNKSVEYVRDFFGIKISGYTPEEKEKVRQENAWAFDGVDGD